jgi:hypothetical protein
MILRSISILQLVIVALSVLGCTLLVCAESSIDIEAVEIIEYGRYCIDPNGDPVKMESAATGNVIPISHARLLAHTNQIPAEIGNSFGCRFLIKGKPQDAPVDVIVIVKHPAFSKPGRSLTDEDKVPWVYRLGKKSGYIYRLDHQWECIPGQWSIQVWWNGNIYAEQIFILTETGNIKQRILGEAGSSLPSPLEYGAVGARESEIEFQQPPGTGNGSADGSD